MPRGQEFLSAPNRRRAKWGLNWVFLLDAAACPHSTLPSALFQGCAKMAESSRANTQYLWEQTCMRSRISQEKPKELSLEYKELRNTRILSVISIMLLKPHYILMPLFFLSSSLIFFSHYGPWGRKNFSPFPSPLSFSSHPIIPPPFPTSQNLLLFSLWTSLWLPF